jgi:hypothetical protein
MFNLGKYDRRLKCLLGAGAMTLLSLPVLAAEKKFTYNLAAGTSSAAIKIPVADTPVSVTCSQNAVGFRGVGQATILKTSVAPNFLEWVGTDIATTAVTSGFSASAGTHIVYCDYVGKTVDMQVNDAGSIKIVNTSGSTATGVITFFY